MDITSDIDNWPGLVERPARGTGTWPENVVAVLVHGAMDRGAGQAHLARKLRDVATMRYDRRGYGRARSLGTTDLVGHVDDLIALVDDRPVVLFGHSFGGLVVLGAAASRQLDVRGIATWEVPAPWFGDWPSWDINQEHSDPEDVAEGFMRAVIGDERWRGLPERVQKARRAEGPSLLCDMDPRLEAGVPFDPGAIDAQCVLGVGDVSSAPYPEAARWLADRIAHAEVEMITGATHGAPLRRASAIAALIRRAGGSSHPHRETS